MVSTSAKAIWRAGEVIVARQEVASYHGFSFTRIAKTRYYLAHMTSSPLNGRLVLAVLPLLIAAGCSDDDDATASVLVSVVDEAPSANCPRGGIAILTGTDRNRDGVVSADEANDTRYVCASGASVLVLTSVESAGANCEFGGTRIDTGTDANGNGTLEPEELTTPQYACNVDPRAGVLTAEVVALREPTDVVLLDGYVGVEGSVNMGFDEALGPTEVTFAALRFISGELEIDCGGEALTLHLPALEVVGGQLYVRDGCGDVTIDAPKLRRAGELDFRSTYAKSLVLPALESLGYLTIDGTSLETLTLASLKSLSSAEVEGNAALDECQVHDVLTAVRNSGNLNRPTQLSMRDNLPCLDNARRCSTVTVGDATNEFRACFSGRVEWAEARVLCQSFGTGWDLVFASSQEDFETLSTTPTLQLDGYWLGYTDDPLLVPGADEGNYVWVQNEAGSTYAPQGPGEALDALFWKEGDPEHGASDNCAALERSGYRPNSLRAFDTSCTDTLLPICRHL